ncbi:MAG: hypothetical protein IKV41_00245 [Oscillospiraceae bacterium]|nr:hypothetical protein [Oscillospiraceae bacterium]
MNKKVLVCLAAALTFAFAGCSGAADAQAQFEAAAKSMKEVTGANQICTLDVDIIQEDAPQVSFFDKTITSAYCNSGADGFTRLEAKQFGESQHIEVLFKDGGMYQAIEGGRFVALNEENVNAAKADMLQLYRYKLPAKLAENKDNLENVSVKKQDGASIVSCSVKEEAAHDFAQYFFIDFIVGDEEVLEENKKEMLETMKEQREMLPEEERAQYTDEKLMEMAAAQIDGFKQNYLNLFDAVEVSNIQYEGKMENGMIASQKVQADAVYRGQSYHMVFTDEFSNINAEADMSEMPQMNEENIITMEQYQQEMMLMQMMLMQMQQAQ